MTQMASWLSPKDNADLRSVLRRHGGRAGIRRLTVDFTGSAPSVSIVMNDNMYTYPLLRDVHTELEGLVTWLAVTLYGQNAPAYRVAALDRGLTRARAYRRLVTVSMRDGVVEIG